MDADFQAAIDKDKEHRENLLQRIESWNYLTEAFIPFIQRMYLFRSLSFRETRNIILFA